MTLAHKFEISSKLSSKCNIALRSQFESCNPVTPRTKLKLKNQRCDHAFDCSCMILIQCFQQPPFTCCPNYSLKVQCLINVNKRITEIKTYIVGKYSWTPNSMSTNFFFSVLLKPVRMALVKHFKSNAANYSPNGLIHFFGLY